MALVLGCDPVVLPGRLESALKVGDDRRVRDFVIEAKVKKLSIGELFDKAVQFLQSRGWVVNFENDLDKTPALYVRRNPHSMYIPS